MVVWSGRGSLRESGAGKETKRRRPKCRFVTTRTTRLLLTRHRQLQFTPSKLVRHHVHHPPDPPVLPTDPHPLTIPLPSTSPLPSPPLVPPAFLLVSSPTPRRTRRIPRASLQLHPAPLARLDPHHPRYSPHSRSRLIRRRRSSVDCH